MKVWLLVAVSVFVFSSAGRSAEPDPKGIEFFETRIRPVLVDNCYICHSVGAKKSKGGLQLDTKAGLLKGGGTGPAIVPGKPGESLLLKAIQHKGEIKMPSEEKKLPEAVIKDMAKWIEIGAPDPRFEWESRESHRLESGPSILVLQTGYQANPAECQRFRLGQVSNRSVRVGETGGKRLEAGWACGCPNSRSPRLFRFDRFAANSRGRRGVCKSVSGAT